MKKVSMLLLLSLIVLVVIAQKNNNHSINYKNSSYTSVRDYLKATQPQIWKLLNKPNEASSPKATNEFKQALDSTVSMEIDWTKDLVKEGSEIYTYDAQGRCVMIQNNDYDGDTFSPEYKMTVTYNNVNMPTSVMYEEYDAGVWEPTEKFDITYEGGLMTELLLYEWDDNQWKIELKEVVTYDDYDNITLYTSYEWDGTTFINDDKEEYTYYENEYEHESITSDWVSDSWVLEYKTESSYDGNWNNVLTVESVWNSSEWAETYKTENTYSENNLVSSINSSYNGSWNYNWKDEYSYDDNGNITENIEYSWQGDSWGLVFKETFSFNYDYTSDDLLMPFFWEYEYNNMLLGINEYSYNDDNWENTKQQLMYYSEKNMNAIDKIDMANNVVYPNPNNGIFNLKINSDFQDIEVSVLDFSGRVIYSKTVNNSRVGDIEVPFDLSAAGTGIYFIRISQDHQTSYQKVVVQ